MPWHDEGLLIRFTKRNGDSCVGALRLGLRFGLFLRETEGKPTILEVLYACEEHVPCEVFSSILGTSFGSEKRAAVYRL